jgi:hypothetical protein
MKVIRIITTILVSVGMALVFACSEEKTASLEGHDDIVAVLQKLPECLDKPEVNREIYADNAILKQEDGWTGHLVEIKGLKEIENWRKDRSKVWRRDCSAKMSKVGSAWKIMEEIVKGELK